LMMHVSFLGASEYGRDRSLQVTGRGGHPLAYCQPDVQSEDMRQAQSVRSSVSVLDRFSDALGLNRRQAFQVGDCAGYLRNAVVSTALSPGCVIALSSNL